MSGGKGTDSIPGCHIVKEKNNVNGGGSHDGVDESQIWLLYCGIRVNKRGAGETIYYRGLFW